jgi:hypothetical protein
MKFSKQIFQPATLLATVAALSIGFSPLNSSAADDSSTKPDGRKFASPDEAVQALRTAAESKDQGALREIFGPQFKELLTGDKVQDAQNAQKFANVMAEGCSPVTEGDKVTLEIGTNHWPLPIPLVKVNDQWQFDTAAGKEEIINRHIGKDELSAIGVCRTYVKAQQQFASANQNTYAEKFKSSTGKKDGLYWHAADGEPESPFGPLVAEAHAEGYTSHLRPHPFHGYYFHILTRQGEAAPGGKMNYVSDGKLTGGFALIAYPEKWDQSGVMTFIVNQDGKIYQRNLGEDTLHLARDIKEYNPDSQWTLVEDEGIADAATEK